MRRVLDSQFERLSKKADSMEEDKAFMSWARKQYKGICGKCGEYGHSSSNCPKNNNNNRFKSQTKTHGHNRLSRSNNNNTSNTRPSSTKICNWCGKYGHTSSECKGKKAREAFLNSTKERGNAAVEELEEENYIEETDKDFQSDD